MMTTASDGDPTLGQDNARMGNALDRRSTRHGVPDHSVHSRQRLGPDLLKFANATGSQFNALFPWLFLDGTVRAGRPLLQCVDRDCPVESIVCREHRFAPGVPLIAFEYRPRPDDCAPIPGTTTAPALLVLPDPRDVAPRPREQSFSPKADGRFRGTGELQQLVGRGDINEVTGKRIDDPFLQVRKEGEVRLDAKVEEPICHRRRRRRLLCCP